MATEGHTFSMAQVLQQGEDMELPDDILIAEICLDNEQDIYFIHMYDSIVDNFTLQFVKRKGSEVVGSISLSTLMVKRIIFILPRLSNLVARYKNKDITREINFLYLN